MSQSPTEKQIRMMHIVNLMSIAFADGTITEDEKNVLTHLAQDLDLTEEEFDLCIEHWKNTDENNIPIAVPENDEEQVEFMKHFALVMMIDGEINPQERDYLSHVVDTFGYNPDGVVQMLIDDVYQQYFADGDEPDGDEAEEEEDPLFADTDDDYQLEMGKMKLEQKYVEEAFDYLFLPALRNSDACAYFLLIPNTDTRLFRLGSDRIAKVQEAADKGYALAHYVMGRYHQVVKPDGDSLNKAFQYLQSASKAGIPDAQWALAMLSLCGYLGPVDFEAYNDTLAQALDNGSMRAFKQRIHDTIHGLHGNKAAPKNAIKVIESFLEQDETYAAIHPDVYDLLGDAYRKVGNKDKADNCYEKAADLGYFEAGAHRFENRVEGPDRDFYRETLSLLLDFSCDNNDPNSFLARALEHAYHYDKADSDAERESLAAKLSDDLHTAYSLGLGDAAYYLGHYSYTGTCGFARNADEAWQWFAKGQDLESGLAFAGAARMVEDGVCPPDLPDNYLLFCKLSALRRGVGEMLHDVVAAYKSGQLDDVAVEVEKNYIPMLRQVATADGIPTVLIVSPDLKATVCKLEKEDWYKLANLIGAKRLAPIRVNALDKLGNKAGFNDHLVAWVDIDAPRKGLAPNKVASAFYPGVIAGDVVFSLADKLYDPMPFYGVEEAESAAKVLKAKVQGVVTDLAQVSSTRQPHADYSKVNPYVEKGYVARIEPDGKAHIVESGLQVFALFEEDIYDPARLQSLYDLGTQLGLKGRLTIWIDNSSLRKQLVMYDKVTPNPIGVKHYPGPVADNLFVAMEDENHRIMLFDDPDQLRKVCTALGCKL